MLPAPPRSLRSICRAREPRPRATASYFFPSGLWAAFLPMKAAELLPIQQIRGQLRRRRRPHIQVHLDQARSAHVLHSMPSIQARDRHRASAQAKDPRKALSRIKALIIQIKINLAVKHETRSSPEQNQRRHDISSATVTDRPSFSLD